MKIIAIKNTTIMNKVMYKLTLISFLLCLSAFTKTATVSVIAHMKDGAELVTDAYISIDNGAEIIRADELGLFTLNLKKDKKYDLEVRAKGYETIKQKDFQAKEDMEIRFILKKVAH